MSIEKRKIGKKPYVARVYIGSVNGVPRHRSKSFSKLSDAKDFESKYTNFKNNSIDRSISDKVLLATVFQSYVGEAEKRLKDNSIKGYKSAFNKWIEPHLGTFQIGNVNHLTLIRFFEIIREKDASDYMMNYVFIVLGELFKFASNSLERYILTNPMVGLSSIRIEQNSVQPIKFWIKENANEVLKSIVGHHYYPILVLFMNTGLREGEGMALTEECFDFHNNILKIRQQLTNYEPKKGEEKFVGHSYVVSSTKGNETRDIPLNKQAVEAAKILIERSKKSGSRYLMTPKNKSKKSRVVIKRGAKAQVVLENVLSTRTLGNFIEKISDLKEVASIGPHGLRHTFGANFMMNGGDIYALSKLLGHKDISSTQIYAHLSDKYLKHSMKIVGFGG